MTKAEAIDIIYLNLNGGKASSDNNVKRDEISVYFPVALGTAIKNHIFELKQMAAQDKSGGDVLFEKSLPEGLFSIVSGTPEFVDDRAAYRMVINKVLSLPNGWGIRNPRAKKNPGADFFRLSNPTMVSAFPDVFAGQFSYWTEEDGEATNVYFNNLPAPICPMVISVILDPKDLADDAELNAPKDVTDAAIRLATEYFSKQFPASRRFDDKGTREQEA